MPILTHRATEIETELGIERLCTRCQEFWPRDAEFWFLRADGRVLGHCKACFYELRRAKRDRAKQRQAA